MSQTTNQNERNPWLTAPLGQAQGGPGWLCALLFHKG